MKTFLDNRANKKLRLLTIISHADKSMTVSDISQMIGYSFHFVRELLYEMEEEGIFTYDPNVHITIQKKNQLIHTIKITNLSVDVIASKYLFDSIIYQMVLDIFMNGHMNRQKFCELHYISQATFSRKRTTLKKILNQMQLDLNRNNSIVGEELRIRTFFFYFFSHSSAKWLFNTDTFQEINYFFHQHNSQDWQAHTLNWQNKLALLLYISKMRIAQNQMIQFDLNLQELAFYHEYDLLTSCYQFLARNNLYQKEILENEFLFLLFMLLKEFLWVDLTFLQQLTSVLQKNDLADTLTQQLTQTLSQLNPFFVNHDYIYPYFYIFHYNLKFGFIDTRYFLYVYDPENFYFKDTAEQKLASQLNIAYEQLLRKTTYQQFLADYQLNQELYTEALYIVTYNVRAFLPAKKAPTIYLYVQNKKTPIENVLKYKLRSIYQDRIQFLHDLTTVTPDFIITDELIVDDPTNIKHSQVIYVTSFSNKHDLTQLYRMIDQKILADFYHRDIY